ncbi:hypothetical protein [Micromonospora sp. NPDC050276]|uniref:hypothetical protein n=1 Tax=Micromonospora sp. NPDC050276 TaxID=3364278 RepID=UPI00378888A6
MAEAFLSGLPEGEHRQRYSAVYLLTVLTEENGRRTRHNAGVFLTEADAEEAKRLVEPRVERCWVESLTVVL